MMCILRLTLSTHCEATRPSGRCLPLWRRSEEWESGLDDLGRKRVVGMTTAKERYARVLPGPTDRFHHGSAAVIERGSD